MNVVIVLALTLGAAAVAYTAFLVVLRVRLPRMMLVVGKPRTEEREPPEQRPGVAVREVGVGGTRTWVCEPGQGDVIGTVIAVHGIHNDARAIVGFGQRCAGVGLRVLMPDLAGSGTDGERVRRGYGALESRALRELVDRCSIIGAAIPITPPLLAVGFSYGGSVCCQLARADSRIRGVASIAAFSDLFRAVRDRLPSVLPWKPLRHVVPDALLESAVRAGAARGGFSVPDCDAAAAIETAAREHGIRLLALHGDLDSVLGLPHSERLVHAVLREGGHAELFVEPGADHDSVFRSERVRAHLVDWLVARALEASRGNEPVDDVGFDARKDTSGRNVDEAAAG